VGDDRPDRLTLLICDDHRVLTDALAAAIGSEEGIDFVADPVHRPEDAIDLCRELSPDVVLMDIQLEGEMDGVQATREIRRSCPGTNVVVMSATGDARRIVAAVEAGACGFLTKTEPLEEVVRAIRSAARGEVLIDPGVLTSVLREIAADREAKGDVDSRFARLTDREREILQMLAEGARNDQIAKRLFIRAQTVQTHIRNMLSKLGVHSRLEAVSLAVRHGVVSV